MREAVRAGFAEENGVVLIEWRPLAKNTLRGFATVRLRALGLTVSDVAVHASRGRSWASLPMKAVVGSDGQALRAPILQWTSSDIADRFSAAVVEEVERRHPGAVRDARGLPGGTEGAQLSSRAQPSPWHSSA